SGNIINSMGSAKGLREVIYDSIQNRSTDSGVFKRPGLVRDFQGDVVIQSSLWAPEATEVRDNRTIERDTSSDHKPVTSDDSNVGGSIQGRFRFAPSVAGNHGPSAQIEVVGGGGRGKAHEQERTHGTSV